MNRSILGGVNWLAVFMAISVAGPTRLYAAVLFSDDFESYSVWDGCPDDTVSAHLPEWNAYFNTWTCGTFEIADDSANKVIRFKWPQAMKGLGPAVPPQLTAGRSEVYVGFRWRHDAGWNWGSDPTHKWVYFPQTGGNRTMLSIVHGGIAWFDGQDYNMAATDGPSANSSTWLNDSDWHDVIIFVAPGSSTLRVWYDGGELSWAENNVGGASYGGAAFDSSAGDAFVFGYQSRPDWGAGNTSYFDDIIVATSKAEVDAFLGSKPVPADGAVPSDGGPGDAAPVADGPLVDGASGDGRLADSSPVADGPLDGASAADTFADGANPRTGDSTSRISNSDGCDCVVGRSEEAPFGVALLILGLLALRSLRRCRDCGGKPPSP